MPSSEPEQRAVRVLGATVVLVGVAFLVNVTIGVVETDDGYVVLESDFVNSGDPVAGGNERSPAVRRRSGAGRSRAAVAVRSSDLDVVGLDARV